MKKISGGFGKEIEVSEDVADDVDPESMLSETIPVLEHNIKQQQTEDDEQILSVVHLSFIDNSGETQEHKISGFFKRLAYIQKETIYSQEKILVEYEFIMLRKAFLPIIEFAQFELLGITLYSGESEKSVLTGSRAIKRIDFEPFGKQIKCSLVA